MPGATEHDRFSGPLIRVFCMRRDFWRKQPLPEGLVAGQRAQESRAVGYYLESRPLLRRGGAGHLGRDRARSHLGSLARARLLLRAFSLPNGLKKLQFG